MADSRRALQSRFEPQHRFENFGNVIVKMMVNGFRCHDQTIVDIRSPITAFCGLNGTGKTTLIQLLPAYTKTGQIRTILATFLLLGYWTLHHSRQQLAWLLTSGSNLGKHVQSPCRDEHRRSAGLTIGGEILGIRSSLAVGCSCHVQSDGTLSSVTSLVS